MADRMPAGSVSAYLSRLVDQRLVFAKQIPNGKGKLYWHKQFNTEPTMSGAPNRPQATAPAPSVAWPKPLPSERILSPVAALTDKNLDRAAPDVPEVEDEPESPEQKPVVSAALDFNVLNGGGRVIEAPEPRTQAPLNRKGYEFSLTRGPVAFHLPEDLSWQEIVTIGVMLDAYGQLKRREKKATA
jgi:hypothetical protein